MLQAIRVVKQKKMISRFIIERLFIILSFLIVNSVLGQQIQDDVKIEPNDTVVVLKKRAKSVQISVTLKNRTNADTLLIKNFTGDVQTPLFYMPEALGYDRINCEINRLFFRIEDLNGNIVEPIHINLDKTIDREDENYSQQPNNNTLYLSNDTTLNLSLAINSYLQLKKGRYNLFIYYCNTDNTTYKLKYESTLIKAVTPTARIPKKVFIGQFSTEPIKLIVK